MRVGIVAEQLRRPAPGGIGTYAAGLLRGLVELGDDDIEPVALASRSRGADPLEDLHTVSRCSILPSRLLVAAWDRGVPLLASGLDLVHLTSFAGPLRGEAPRSAMVHDLAWRHHPELTTRRGARWHEARLAAVVRHADALVVPSATVAAELAATGVDESRIHVIAEGADHLPPPDDDKASELLRDLGVDGNFLLTVSTLEPRKNLDSLIDAWRRLDGAPPLLVVGPSGWGPGVAATEGVLLTGSQPAGVLASLYGRCQAFAYVPHQEGYGLPPLEAMAHGAPVLVSSGVPSCEGTEAAVVVEASDVEAIAAGLEALLSDPEAARERSVAGRSHAGRRRWVDAAAAHVELWRSMA